LLSGFERSRRMRSAGGVFDVPGRCAGVGVTAEFSEARRSFRFAARAVVSLDYRRNGPAERSCLRDLLPDLRVDYLRHVYQPVLSGRSEYRSEPWLPVLAD